MTIKYLKKAACAYLLFFLGSNVVAETLTQYVNTCKAELGFQVVPALNCFDGILFAPNKGFRGEPVNDWVGYARVNNNVDLAFACRWLFDDNIGMARSVEMLLHNRGNGNTCFFSAKEPDPDVRSVPPQLVPVTDSNASSYWRQPADVDAEIRCIGCHAAGPYIASPRIAPALANFGLLNNTHDTFVPDEPGPVRYHAVGESFSAWDSLMDDYLLKSTCANGCHSIAYESPQEPIRRSFDVLLPSISQVISIVRQEGVMPPNGADSPYRWINLDSVAGSGDRETFNESKDKDKFEKLLRYCGAPTELEAHVVGSDRVFMVPSPFPDKLATFNLHDGLRCVNAEQSDGSCNDYQTRYLCDGEWTNWYNMDNPGFQEDNESRSLISGLCPSPTAIEARTIVMDAVYVAYGPNDRLAQFTPYGLVCNNADQPNGQCSNYVVRYGGCIDAPEPYEAVIRSAWSWNLLTAIGAQNDAETRAQPENSSWTSQDWVIEPVEASTNVRIKNVWTGRYLNVQNNGESAKVVTYDLMPEWTSQQWIIEPVWASSDVRLRNVWSGRYLTVADSGDYAAVLSQSLNTGWISQRWRIE